MRFLKTLTVVVGGLVAFATMSHVFAGQKNYTFTNTAGSMRNDLHIEFKQPVTMIPAIPSPFTTATGSGTSTIDMSGGTGVPAAGSVGPVGFTTSWTGPTIQSGYWTLNGTQMEPLSTLNCDPYP